MDDETRIAPTDRTPETAPSAPTGPTTQPYGSWPSPIRIDDLVADVVGLSDSWIDGDDTYWVESRPAEGGRSVLVRHRADGSTADVTPPPFNVGSRVHEYGGGAYTAAGGTVVFSNMADGRLYRIDPGDDEAQPITPEGPFRYADLRFDRRRRRFVAIREDHSTSDSDPSAAIVAVPLDGEHPPRVLYEGPDFIAAPRPSPDGSWLAWLEWDHPDMPWDASRLRVAPVADDGSLGPSDLAAGGIDESIAQPDWSPNGVLHFVSDRTGWWNIYRLLDGPRLETLTPMDAEFADPAWIFDRSSYGFLADGSLAAVGRARGRDRLFHVTPGSIVGEVDSPYTEIGTLRVAAGRVVAIVATPTDAQMIVSFDPMTLATAGVLRHATSVAVDPAFVSMAEPITFPTAGGRVAHALFYRQRNPDCAGMNGELPPLLVRSHGGPTSSATNALDLTVQYLTSRGVAVVDVDYGGSTGYGREYRQALDGNYGIVDVDDCVGAARYLVERGDVDGDRLAIEGSSSGGYTALAALAFRDAFAAGISIFGFSDLGPLAQESHKFEARYMDRLVGPYPESADVYRERSPIHVLDRISSPVLVLQGLDDRVVPPENAETLVEALRANGIPHAYIAFEGEGHGFRGQLAQRRTLEARLAFLGAVFGFTPADDLEPLDVVGLEAWQADRRGVPIG